MPILVVVTPAPQLECVPNVSEGRRPIVIEALTESITAVEGVRLLHRDVGVDANRTVFTFVGDPLPVRLAAKQLAAACLEHIDLREYSGTHPYIGALDVCPFVPLWGLDATEAEAAALALARYSAETLGVPAYLYAKSATRKSYRSLARVRQGGLAAVAKRSPANGPDFGTGIHPTAGASVFGARDILIAYNVNLATKDAAVAKTIAAHIRASNRESGLPAVRAIGWYQEAFGCAQVSCNLLDYRVTGLGEVYRAVDAHARTLGTQAAGSELIGLVPEEALGAVPRQFGEADPDTSSAVNQAAQLLGLDRVRDWRAEERVLEWVFWRKPKLP